MLTLALVIAFSTIFILFSKEFGALFKKIFAVPGVKLFLPLITATLLVVFYEPWVYFVLLYTKRALHNLITLLAYYLPFETGATSLISIFVVMGITILPAYAMNVWSIRKTHLPFEHSKFLSAFLWLLVIILITIGFY